MSGEENNEYHEYQELFTRQLEKYRLEKGVSQREMSLSLGQTPGYIAKLSNHKGHNLPRMINFFYICDYFGIHPSDFFDEQAIHPEKINDLIQNIYKLSDSQLSYICELVKDLAQNS